MKNSHSDNCIYKTFMQYAGNQTEQLVVNDLFKHRSELHLFPVCTGKGITGDVVHLNSVVLPDRYKKTSK